MLRRIERLLVDLSIAAVAGLCALITLNVALRALFNGGVPDSTTLVAELMIAAVVLPMAAATTQRAHIAVDLIAKRLPRRVGDGLIVFGSIFGLIALSPLIWAGTREVLGVIEKGSFFYGELQLPKWPGRVLFLIGMAICWLRLLVMVIRDIRTLRKGGSLSDDHPEEAA